MRYGEGCRIPIVEGNSASCSKVSFYFLSRNALFWCILGHFGVLQNHCNTSRYSPRVHLPSLTFQPEVSSVKGAMELAAGDGTEHYLPSR